MPPSDDAELITRARAGDRRAIDELLARYEPNIYRFGLRMCGDEDAAREVLQETLLAAFRYLSGFRGDAALSTWLYQIARSFCIKERRGHHPTDSLDDDTAGAVVAWEAVIERFLLWGLAGFIVAAPRARLARRSHSSRSSPRSPARAGKAAAGSGYGGRLRRGIRRWPG